MSQPGRAITAFYWNLGDVVKIFCHQLFVRDQNTGSRSDAVRDRASSDCSISRARSFCKFDSFNQHVQQDAQVDLMHEYSLVRSILRSVEQIAVQQGTQRLASIQVTIGEFSGIEAALLEMAFQDLSQASPLKGATLTIQTCPLTVVCEDCQRESAIQNFHFVCRHCESRNVGIVSGEELRLDHVTFVEGE